MSPGVCTACNRYSDQCECPGSVPVIAERADQDSIFLWAEQTFGQVSPARAAARVLKEAVELQEAAIRYAETGDQSALEVELADVMITLFRLAGVLDVDAMRLVGEKMAVNRQRKWKLDGRGGGQHV